MVYKSVSCKAQIARIYRDFKPTNSDWLGDCIEWIGEAIDAMKIFNGYVDRYCDVKVIDFRAKIPCALEMLQGITYKGKKLQRSGNIRHKAPSRKALEGVETCLVHSYSLNPNYIHTNFKEGIIRIYFLGVDVDDEGFPKIIDNFFVKEAISWFIISRMLLRGYKHPFVTYEFADRKWTEFYPKAQNQCKMPDIDNYDLFMRTYMGLVRDITMNDTMFEDSSFDGSLHSIAKPNIPHS